MATENRPIELRLPLGASLPRPEAANFFNFTLAGPEVEMLIGVVDLRQLVFGPDNIPESVEPEITHRFFMSTRGLEFLKAQVDDIYGKYQEIVAAEAGVPLNK